MENNNDSIAIDYSDSTARSMFTWLAYPAFVLLPFVLVLIFIDPKNPEPMIAVALLSYLILPLLERLHPNCKHWLKSQNDIITDIAHLFFSIGFSALLRALLVYVFFLILNSNEHAFSLLPWPSDTPLWMQACLGLIIAEFGEYWRHRVFHEWHLTWRFHAVHHCSKRLYFLNATRFHVVDLCIGGLSSAIPLTLCGATPEIAILVGVFTGLHGNWQHANVRYKLGWLNYIFAAAEAHRWHHSSIIRHSNSNYGNNLIIWDLVFGTFCIPKKAQDFSQMGLGEHDQYFPTSWWQQQRVPFFWKATVEPTGETTLSSNIYDENDV